MGYRKTYSPLTDDGQALTLKDATRNVKSNDVLVHPMDVAPRASYRAMSPALANHYEEFIQR